MLKLRSVLPATSAQAHMAQARHWCFTDNNPDGDLNVCLNTTGVRYAVWQLEVGENGTEHHQGYVELERSQRLSWVKNLIPEAHWETRKGSRDQARNYCMKTEGRLDGPWEIGDYTSGGQGNRTDIQELKTDIDHGMSEREIWDKHPLAYLRYNRAIKDARRLVTANRDYKTEVTVVYGPPGTGKSWYAEQYTDKKAYWKQRSQWWCGYEGQDVVLDEYYAWLPWDLLLRLLDRYPMLVETKGGQVNFTAKKIVITSNKLPEQWYQDSYPLQALIRRIDRYVYKFELQTDALVFDDYTAFRQAVYDQEQQHQQQ